MSVYLVEKWHLQRYKIKSQWVGFCLRRHPSPPHNKVVVCQSEMRNKKPSLEGNKEWFALLEQSGSCTMKLSIAEFPNFSGLVVWNEREKQGNVFVRSSMQTGVRTMAVLTCTCICKWATGIGVMMAVLVSPRMCKWGHQCLRGGATASEAGLTSYSRGPMANRRCSSTELRTIGWGSLFYWIGTYTTTLSLRFHLGEIIL